MNHHEYCDKVLNEGNEGSKKIHVQSDNGRYISLDLSSQADFYIDYFDLDKGGRLNAMQIYNLMQYQYTCYRTTPDKNEQYPDVVGRPQLTNLVYDEVKRKVQQMRAQNKQGKSKNK